MKQFDVNAFLEAARSRELTADEIAELTAWSETFVEPIGEVTKQNEHPLLRLMLDYTAKTKVSSLFTTNFKKVNFAIMPRILKLLKPLEEKIAAERHETTEANLRDAGYYEPLPPITPKR